MHPSTPDAPSHRRRRGMRRAAVAAASVSALVAGTYAIVAPAGAASTTTAPSAGQPHVKRLCSQPDKPGEMACNAMVRTDVVEPHTMGAHDTPQGFGPSDLQKAYNLSGDGSGQTVAIVDAQDDPNAEQDMAAYRKQYGLPDCSSSSGCFKKIDQNGGKSYPSADAGWAGEISLDLDMVSAVAPKANILLVEANSANTPDLGAAVNQAVKQGAKFVSNSYGGNEDPSDTQTDSQYYNHPGVVITASAGDSGFGVEYPAASPDVTAVGGTSLTKDSSSRGYSEKAWGSNSGGDGTGSGCSTVETKPKWQTDNGCSKRTVADVSAVADPATGLAVYDSYQSNGWQVVGGTSASSPIIASVYALAGAPSSGSNPAEFPYKNASALNDVASGSNGSCNPSYLCTAGQGYDGPTGLGTPNGTKAFTG